MKLVDEKLHDTPKSYDTVDYKGIEYSVCKDYSHISRYKRLRQVIHYLEGNNRFITLETQNSYNYEDLNVEYFTVTTQYENRLDLISYKYYKTTSYSWVIAYVNKIQDGFTVYEGQVLMIPLDITDLFKSGNVLSSVPATTLNLGTE